MQIRHKLLIVALTAIGLTAAGLVATRGLAVTALHPSAACMAPERQQIFIPGGTFSMGSEEYYEEEGPVHTVTVAGFWIDRTDVTNAEFARFVAATHYVTDAERKPDPKDYPDIPPDKLQAGGALIFTSPTGVRSLEDPQRLVGLRARGGLAASRLVRAVPSSSHDNDPVVQVSYNDALAYARWAGRDLPTEEQYEYAARGGLWTAKTYAWGDELSARREVPGECLAGDLPKPQQKGADGFSGRAPVRLLSGQRLRPLRHDRQCLEMDCDSL